MEIVDQLTPVRQMALAGSQKRGRVLAFTSGKGGVGKSNISLNLSIALAELGQSVCLFDADTNMANLNVLTGHKSTSSLADVLYGEKNFSDIVVDHGSGVKIVSAGAGTDEWMGLTDSIKEKFFQEIFRYSTSQDFIFIDTSAGLSQAVVDFVLRADEVVVVTSPEPTSISDAYALVKVLYSMKPHISFKTLVNFVESEEDAEEVFERFALVVQHFLQVDTDLMGFVVEDKHVRNAVQAQHPLLNAYPASKASKCIRRIAKRLVV